MEESKGATERTRYSGQCLYLHPDGIFRICRITGDAGPLGGILCDVHDRISRRGLSTRRKSCTATIATFRALSHHDCVGYKKQDIWSSMQRQSTLSVG